MRTRVKICGVTNAADARAAVDAGADAVGVIVYAPSPRCAAPDSAAAIRAAVPPFVSLVLVTVDLERDEQRRWIARLRPDLLQFHGDEPPGHCAAFGLPYVKSVRVRDGGDAGAAARRYAGAAAVLMDTYVEGVVGGTGRRFDWSLARRAGDKPLILAGGLTIDNVAEAIRVAAPYAVDVNSSLETRPGVKDHASMRAFVAAVERGSAQRVADR